MDTTHTRSGKKPYGFCRHAYLKLSRAIQSEKGVVSLMEVMITSTLSVLLMLAVISSSAMMVQAGHEYNSNVKLVNNARLVSDRITWGHRLSLANQRRGIAEAVISSVVIAPTQIDYNDVDGVAHSYRLMNGNIEYRRAAGNYQVVYDPNGAPAFDANKYSTSLNFVSDPGNVNYVTIELVLGENILGRWYYGSLSTKVAFRNS